MARLSSTGRGSAERRRKTVSIERRPKRIFFSVGSAAHTATPIRRPYLGRPGDRVTPNRTFRRRGAAAGGACPHPPAGPPPGRRQRPYRPGPRHRRKPYRAVEASGTRPGDARHRQPAVSRHGIASAVLRGAHLAPPAPAAADPDGPAPVGPLSSRCERRLYFAWAAFVQATASFRCSAQTASQDPGWGPPDRFCTTPGKGPR